MYIHLHSHVLGNMLLLIFFIKVFLMDAWFSGCFSQPFSVQNTDNRQLHMHNLKYKKMHINVNSADWRSIDSRVLLCRRG